VTIGAGVGLLTGLVGVGGGFLYVPALTLLAGLDMKHAVGTSLALITVSCAAGLAGYLGRVHLDWVLIAIFTALAFVGVICRIENGGAAGRDQPGMRDDGAFGSVG
jgi:uncharacterized membrane protein YfcA